MAKIKREGLGDASGWGLHRGGSKGTTPITKLSSELYTCAMARAPPSDTRTSNHDKLKRGLSYWHKHQIPETVTGGFPGSGLPGMMEIRATLDSVVR